jgi:hypothetical protein
MELAAPEIVRILIGRAQCGDRSMEAAKYILERIAPSRRGRLVEIEGFPEIRAPADVPAALVSLATAIGDGIITIEEATAAGSLLQTFLDTYETAQRLAKGLGRQRARHWLKQCRWVPSNAEASAAANVTRKFLYVFERAHGSALGRLRP